MKECSSSRIGRVGLLAAVILCIGHRGSSQGQTGPYVWKSLRTVTTTRTTLPGTNMQAVVICCPKP